MVVDANSNEATNEDGQSCSSPLSSNLLPASIMDDSKLSMFDSRCFVREAGGRGVVVQGALNKCSKLRAWNSEISVLSRSDATSMLPLNNASESGRRILCK